MTTFDQNGAAVAYGDWLASCGDDSASDGARVTSAKALQIAHDVLSRRPHSWTDGDIALACGAIAGIRAQRGCEAVTDDGCEYLTELMDVTIYG